MRPQSATTPEGLIASLASRQHGVVSLAQLIAAGVSARAASRRVRANRLHRIHRGVFAVGHTSLTKEGRWLAAALACGPTAVLSHQSAAALWDLLAVPGGPIEVTVAGSGGRRARQGIAVHRSSTLEPGCCTQHLGIPVTTPARTIADLRHVLPTRRYLAAVRRAEVLRLDVGMQAGHTPDPARSELERCFARLCRERGLPDPEHNARVGPFEVDFVWRNHRLIVETDGFRHHGTRSAFEADRERDVRLGLFGYRVVRFTYRQLTEQADDVAAALHALLAH